MLLTDIIRYNPYQYLLIFPLNLFTMHKKIIKHVNATVVKLDEFSKLAYGMNGKVALCKIIGEALGNINHICMQSKVPAVN